MGVFTCHKPKAFVCVFIKLVYDCIQWKLNVSVYMPVAIPRLIVFPVPLWRVDMSLYVSKRLKDLSTVAVEGGIVRKNTIGIRMQVFVYKFQCLAHIACVYLCGLRGKILTLRSIFLLQG
jgi:hypothetical protein